MNRWRSLPGVLTLGALLFVVGCTDAPTAPVQPVEPSSDFLSTGDLTSSLDLLGQDVTVLQRAVPLERDEVVTRTIGRRGGVIHLPEAGLTVFVPWGALKQATEITVTAPAGDLVGYYFEPHGLEFRRDVTLTQDMSLTQLLAGTDLSAVYFRGELEPTVTALEVLPLWLLRWLGIFQIEHFSGYVIATN